MNSSCGTRLPCILIVALIAGCGASGPAPDADAPPQAADAASTTNSTTTGATSPNTQPVGEVLVSTSGVEWIAPVKADVFFDNPLVIASDGTQFVMTPQSVEQPANATGDDPPMTDTTTDEGSTAAPSAGDIDWSKLISAELLQDEIKQVRNRLTTNLRTLGNYNRNIDSIASDGIVLSTLAMIVQAHSGDINWKEKAPNIRNLSYDIYMNAEGTGRSSFDATEKPFVKVMTLMDGGPAPKEEVEAVVPFSDIADRSSMMQRIEKAANWLQKDVVSESDMVDKQSDIRREAAVLATLGTIVSLPEYDSAQEEDYKKFIKQLIDNSVAASEATQTDNFEAYQTAISAVHSACGACHQKYVFADDGLQ